MNKQWLVACGIGMLFSSVSALAADSAGCEKGGFTALGIGGATTANVAPGSVASRFRVQGKYVQFDVDAATFGVLNFTMTGAANALDLTGGRSTPVFESKIPDHRGLTLTSSVAVELGEAGITLTRTGPGVSMKLTAKDCATGGIFQMEVERTDEAKTVFTHKLADSAFYFDNRNFRNREGDVVAFKDTTLVVPSRVNFGNDYSRKFVGRDSAQFADRITSPTCTNNIVDPHGRHQQGAALRRGVAMVGLQRRPSRPGHGRRQHRSRTGTDAVHAQMPGAEPGQRPVDRARIPVPRGRCRPPQATPAITTASTPADSAKRYRSGCPGGSAFLRHALTSGIYLD